MAALNSYLSFLHSSGATTSHSPRDTYTRDNSVTERWVRTLKEKVLCMLLCSSLPVAFWWLAVDCACYLLYRIPTKTALFSLYYSRPQVVTNMGV
jgi:hypothetical protein